MPAHFPLRSASAAATRWTTPEPAVLRHGRSRTPHRMEYVPRSPPRESPKTPAMTRVTRTSATASSEPGRHPVDMGRLATAGSVALKIRTSPNPKPRQDGPLPDRIAFSVARTNRKLRRQCHLPVVQRQSNLWRDDTAETVQPVHRFDNDRPGAFIALTRHLLESPLRRARFTTGGSRRSQWTHAWAVDATPSPRTSRRLPHAVDVATETSPRREA